MIRSFIPAAILAGLAATGPAQASNPLLEQALDLPGYAMWSDSGAPGLVIGVVRGNDSLVEGFGNIRPKGDHPEQPNPPPDGRTLLRLGSVTKTFTGIEKSGGGGGFMTCVALAPGRDAAVFVAVNRVNFAMFMELASAANQVLDNLVTR